MPSGTPLAATLALTVSVAVLLGSRAGVRHTGGPLSHDLYVWQRAWDGNVTEAFLQSREFADAHVILGAEVSWIGGVPEAAFVPLDEAASTSGQEPVGLALRINRFEGDAEHYANQAPRLASITGRLMESARAAGLRVREIHVDYDAPESKLLSYAGWLEAIRQAAPGARLTITTLPCWLDADGFPRLLAAVDEHVLQVHSLAAPSAANVEAALCDPRKARRWVERAGSFRTPFRVSLPTYGYRLARDPDGDLLGVEAEGPPLSWGALTGIVEVRSDPTVMSALVSEWTASRPEPMRGLLWYRLPVEGDRLNWSLRTLCRVVRGGAPRSRFEVDLSESRHGLAEVAWRNTGEVDGTPPTSARVSWPAGTLVAADGVSGYEASVCGGGTRRSILFRRPSEYVPIPLPPGAVRRIGWVRFDGDLPTGADVGQE